MLSDKNMLEFDENDELFIGDKLLKNFGNCLDCGRCCKIFNCIEITDDEIKTIAQHLKITKKDFLKKYTKNNQKTKATTKKSLKTPCQFQKITRCSIQSVKPFDCKTYPFLINLTKGQTILTGINFCPQATHFYQGFLKFCQQYNQPLFKEIRMLEKRTNSTPYGLELTLPSKPVKMYIDWFYSR